MKSEKKPRSTDVLCAVVSERARQDRKWGGAQTDDARKTPEDWCNDIEAYVVWARQMHRMASPDKYRRRMMQVAALAVAACESFDRKAANVELTSGPHGPDKGAKMTEIPKDETEGAGGPSALSAGLGALLAPKHTGMKISARGVLGRIRDGRYYKELDFGCGEMLLHMEEMAERFYAGDVKAVDEFLQLYDLAEHRPAPNRY